MGPNGQAFLQPQQQTPGEKRANSMITPDSKQTPQRQILMMGGMLGAKLTPGAPSGNPSPSNPGHRSLSPIGSEIPGEKKFVEVNTQEQLIVSTIGIYASKKGQDKYLPL